MANFASETARLENDVNEIEEPFVCTGIYTDEKTCMKEENFGPAQYPGDNGCIMIKEEKFDEVEEKEITDDFLSTETENPSADSYMRNEEEMDSCSKDSFQKPKKRLKGAKRNSHSADSTEETSSNDDGLISIQLPPGHPCSNEDIMKRLMGVQRNIAVFEKMVLNRFETMEKRMDSMHLLLFEMKLSLGGSVPTRIESLPSESAFEPASTEEELQQIADRRDIVSQLVRCESVSLQKTLTKMMKRVMTYDLAKTFSFSGLGYKRQKTKRAISHHKIYQIVLDTIMISKYHDVQKKEIDIALSNVFKSVPYWVKQK